MTIRVALAEDQALVRDGLRAVLNDFADIQVVVEADSGQPLLDALDGAEVDLIVSDIRMPGLDGIALTRALGPAGHDVPVLLLTTFEDEDLMLEAVQAGARGFLLKDASSADLAAAVRDLAGGGERFEPLNFDRVRERLQYTDDHVGKEQFSPREIEILRLMAGGYSNREIARSVFLAEGTVKNYVSDILAKLDTRDRTRAVLKAITRQII